MGVSEYLIRHLVHEDISRAKWERVNFYKGKTTHQNFWTNLSISYNRTCFGFSHRRTFLQDYIVNSKNNRWRALSPRKLPRVIKTKHSVKIKVFGMVTSDSDIMPLFIFPHGLKLHTDSVTWIERVAARRPYVWQKESAPSRTSRRIHS